MFPECFIGVNQIVISLLWVHVEHRTNVPAHFIDYGHRTAWEQNSWLDPKRARLNCARFRFELGPEGENNGGHKPDLRVFLMRVPSDGPSDRLTCTFHVSDGPQTSRFSAEVGPGCERGPSKSGISYAGPERGPNGFVGQNFVGFDCTNITVSIIQSVAPWLVRVGILATICRNMANRDASQFRGVSRFLFLQCCACSVASRSALIPLKHAELIENSPHKF